MLPLFRVRYYVKGERNLSFVTEYFRAKTAVEAKGKADEALAARGKAISSFHSVDFWG
jgi:hypothetical protein